MKLPIHILWNSNAHLSSFCLERIALIIGDERIMLIIGDDSDLCYNEKSIGNFLYLRSLKRQKKINCSKDLFFYFSLKNLEPELNGLFSLNLRYCLYYDFLSRSYGSSMKNSVIIVDFSTMINLR